MTCYKIEILYFLTVLEIRRRGEIICCVVFVKHFSIWLINRCFRKDNCCCFQVVVIWATFWEVFGARQLWYFDSQKLLRMNLYSIYAKLIENKLNRHTHLFSHGRC